MDDLGHYQGIYFNIVFNESKLSHSANIPAERNSIDQHQNQQQNTSYVGLANELSPAYVVFWCWARLFFPAGLIDMVLCRPL